MLYYVLQSTHALLLSLPYYSTQFGGDVGDNLGQND